MALHFGNQYCHCTANGPNTALKMHQRRIGRHYEVEHCLVTLLQNCVLDQDLVSPHERVWSGDQTRYYVRGCGLEIRLGITYIENLWTLK